MMRMRWLGLWGVLALVACEDGGGAADTTAAETQVMETTSGTEVGPEATTEVVDEVETETETETEVGPETTTEVVDEVEVAETGETETEARADVMLIVAEDGLADVAESWASYRRGEGFEVTVRTVSVLAGEAPDAATFGSAIRQELAAERAAHAPNPRMFALLIGDAPAYGASASGQIPTQACTNTTPGAGACWTDNAYADLDGDGVPDVALGRIPARGDAEARAALAKVQDFEANYRIGEFNRRLSLYVGEAGFGPQIDSAIELAVMEGLKIVNHTFDIVGSWDHATSAYWFTPFVSKVIDLFNDGALMTIYIGHGSEAWTQGLSTADVEDIHCTVRRPIAMFFACFAGNYAASTQSLTERLFAKDDGPIATFGSSDVSHPYGNGVLAYESQRIALDRSQSTVGEVMVAIKRALADNGQDPFRLLISSGASAEPSCATAEQQRQILREHMDLYNLLGDPATHMQYPHGDVSFEPMGGSLWVGHVDVAGTVQGVRNGLALVTFETERDVIHAPLAPVDLANIDPVVVAANWLKANDKALVRVEVPVTEGHFATTLTWSERVSPSDDFYVKVYAHGETTDAIGMMKVPFVPKPD